MGTGYTRNDTANNIADGNVINAADFDGEYDAIEAAFNSSSGHTHDGTASEGGPITVIGPAQQLVATATSINPSTNTGLDLGTTSLQFKDLYIDGVAYIDGFSGDMSIDTNNKLQFRDADLSINSSADGQLDVAADTTVKFTSPEVIMTDDVRLQSDAAILTFGADDDVKITHVADTGLGATAASGFQLSLQTSDISVDNGNTIGKISFNAPLEDSGSDARLVGAEIDAVAENNFGAADNSTALVFKTNTSATATERVRIKSDGDVVFKGAAYDMTWDTSANALDFPDNASIVVGTGDDLTITHNGTNSSIVNATNELIIQGDGITVQSNTGTEKYIDMDVNGAVNLYHNNVKKIETTADGVDVSGDISVGNINLDGNTVSSTDSNGNINLSPNGTGTVVINTDLDIDNININGNAITSTDTNGGIDIVPNGTGVVTLKYNNSDVLETSNSGVTVTGTVTATTFSGAISGTVAAGSTGTTQSQGDNSTKLATTAYVDAATSGTTAGSDANALAFAIALG